MLLRDWGWWFILRCKVVVISLGAVDDFEGWRGDSVVKEGEIRVC